MYVKNSDRNLARRLIVATILIAIALADGQARAATTCPATLNVDQHATTPSSDWTLSYSATPPSLEMVTFFDGPPSDNASLAPDNEKSIGGEIDQTWKLPKSERGYWMQCAYSNTSAVVSRKLPAGDLRCEIVLERDVHTRSGINSLKKAECGPAAP